LYLKFSEAAKQWSNASIYGLRSAELGETKSSYS